MNRQEKSLSTLELPNVLERLAAKAVSEPGKAAVRELRPATSITEIRTRLQETTAARGMLAIKGAPSFHGVKDIAAPLGRADRGGMLNTRELLAIAGVLRAARTVRLYAKAEREQETEIDYLFRSLAGDRHLEEQITTAIVGEDEIADAASTDLAAIRRKIRLTGAKIQETLRKLISSPTHAKNLQDALVTQRSGRYVVPVKAEHKNAIPGLVHDTSSSGQTFFIEPAGVVEANNEIRELETKEQIEIERILMELSAAAAARREDMESDYEILVRLDTIFARAKLGDQLDCTAPTVQTKGETLLKRARHPLLEQKKAVPIDLRLGGPFDTLVITGPNTGGKTVSLKTLGLLTLMAQCGLHIPVDEGSVVTVFSKVLADIGDEQSIEQSLSTFSAHMTNIVDIIEDAGPGVLLLFDELGAGTDPTEGAALAIAIIEHARSRGAMVAATTHYAELKLYATTTPGVVNAACEFDVETLRPTYRLLIGVPGKSNAFAIAARLGLSETVIDDARRRVDADSTSFEEVLTKLDTQRQLMEQERMETDKLLLSAKEDKARAEILRREVEEAKAKARDLARREAQELIEDARRASDEVFAELKEIRRKQAKEQDWQTVNDARSGLRRRLNEAESGLATHTEDTPEEAPARPIEPGDTVELRSIGSKAQVIDIGADGTLTLQAGIMKINAKPNEVRLIEGAKKPDFKRVIAQSEAKLRAAGVKPEVDLRGMMADEAVTATELFLDSAVMSNLGTITIIHGKGTGVLRQAVHESLRRNKQVKDYRLGRYGEGETGVTIVTLK
ncbi:MAG: endonuclease MutS2 [Oscillospiraceae bacterium]|nr:endonuclease MutS2 [Oscillospiraceae bacterium]